MGIRRESLGRRLGEVSPEMLWTDVVSSAKRHSPAAVTPEAQHGNPISPATTTTLLLIRHSPGESFFASIDLTGRHGPGE